MEKTMSIITNFGCHFRCPECIVRNSGINVPKTTLGGLSRLDEMFHRYGCTNVSISGGGDPLYNYKNNLEWYKALFEWAHENSVPIEMHTSYLTDSTAFPFPNCKRVVYHVHTIFDLDHIYRTQNEIVRAVFVVTENFKLYDILAISEYVARSKDIDELSFREYVDGNFVPQPYFSKYLEQGHKKQWYYIKQCDYNLYYAENNVYTSFRDIGIEHIPKGGQHCG